MAGGFTHLNAQGEAHMVDVSAKPESARWATAEGVIAMGDDARRAVREQSIAKGDVLAVARVAGIMAAKRTAELVPLCHTLALHQVELTLVDDASAGGIRATATARTTGRTGVELEALTAVSVALLTVYDMVKSVDRGMTIGGVRLLEKGGGRSGTWRAP
ncbi:MAG: cyclic pyranopterin monophosphate synthase MoaC [Gemmatimonadetes bacterium]|nr:cyclic pyranopterin monophosphate synthase MoaC [Gemmatimonadota bacterium]